MTEEQTRINIDYIKSNEFRVLHVDGAWGGLTPAGLVNMGLYSERPPIPKRTTHDVSADGRLEEVPQLRDVRDVVAIREMEVSALMHPKVAILLRDWLDDKIKQWDNLRKAQTNVSTTENSESD